MDFGVYEALTIFGCLLLSVYYYATSNFGYWKKYKVKGPKPIPIFGNYKDVFLARKSEAVLLKEIYDEYKNEPMVGIFLKNSPRVLLKDPDLLKDVLIQDYHLFRDRGFKVHETNPFSGSLLNLEYKRWKPLRTRLSPIFTSGRLKNMFYLLTDYADNFQKYIEQRVQNNDIIECRELTARYTTDSIAVCAFGLNGNSFDNKCSKFREVGRCFAEDSYRNRLRRGLDFYMPGLYDWFGFWIEPDSINQFFINTFKETMEYRRHNNYRRNDFVDLLMDVKENSDELEDFDFTDTLLIAQAFIFFFGGFEPSSATISNALYELAMNNDIQMKLRHEIREELDKNDGKLTYDCVKNMRYLDKVFKETLRKYPSTVGMWRKAETSYTFKNTNVTIPKDTILPIPIWAIHRDPDIYPDPEVFDPERFSEENVRARHPMNYLPFGAGPRNCIGSRFAYYQVKVGIVAIIEKFRVDVCDKTFKEYRMPPLSFIASSIDGLFLKFSKI